MSILYLFSLVLATLLATVQARTDVAAQLYENSAINTPTKPTSLNEALRKLYVYVLCGRTMSDVFLSADAFDNTTRCPLRKCKSNVITFTTSECESSYVESKALCALSPDAAGSSFGTLKTKAGPLWSTDGQLDESFDPQIYQFRQRLNN
ncbi:hypothetical protein GQ600_20125 [Phytophthora cactorum]|nr:hypothetical protein GQ600_20125 [Phytophthora cactorum]